jgi:hypothetical protein
MFNGRCEEAFRLYEWRARTIVGWAKAAEMSVMY